MDLPFDSVVPLLETYPKNPKTPILKDICTPMFIAVLFVIAKIWKESKCPSVGEWVKKPWDIYTLEYYVAIHKEEILPFTTTSMDLEIVRLSELCQSEKDKYHMISLICGI